MEVDVKKIDKYDKNTRRTIYEAVDEPFLERLNYFLKRFLSTVKSTQTIHKTFYMKPIRIIKPST